MTNPDVPAMLATIAEPRQADADLLAIPCFEGDDLRDLVGLDDATAGEVRRALSSGEFSGKLFEVFLTPFVGGSWRAHRVVLVGAGASADWGPDRARRVAAAVALAARERHTRRLAFLHRAGTGAPQPAGPADETEWAQAIAEGLMLGAFTSGKYKTDEKEQVALSEFTLVLPGLDSGRAAALQASVARGQVLGECTNLARGLANEPGGALTPRVLAERAASIVGSGVGVSVLDERQLGELGMGLLLGVGRGSHEPPRLIVLRYEPPGVPKSPVLGLVGKGVTFDTGGISIKPAAGMERMKDDMAGGAAVICAMRAIARLGAPVPVVGVVPAAENMPGGRALKPGDVLTSASGKTVEVLNTDAEGRLILADGLWYAREQGCTHLVDIATLTGACTVALGRITSGLFGRPLPWLEHVKRVADREGDRCWIMPLFDEYRDQLRSEIADISNEGGRPAGAITAAIFLREFAGPLPWAHMDVAGTAWNDEVRPYLPKGGTGVGVRALAELAFAPIASFTA
jgi:leucyl aminopeptidase